MTGSTNRRFSPRVGILYQPWPWLSLYGNYVESLGANNGGRAVGGKPFDPQTGEQYEAGVKTEFLDGQLSATLAYFHLTKKNSLTADLNNPGFSIAIGEAQSEGVEFDLIGRVTDKLSLITTYAFTDARITKNNDGSVGRELPQVPDHSGSFWAKYELIPQKFELGAGIYLFGNRRGNGGELELPGYGRVDAFAAYHHMVGRTRLTAQININNLLDKDHFKTIAFGPGALPGEPLTVLGSIRLEF